ncbi:MAG: Oligopeptide-binding protein OppA [Chlamydiia bacterium]|nr:Oligopeptide-binding protein OppA [Chlamydiia bacterium]
MVLILKKHLYFCLFFIVISSFFSCSKKPSQDEIKNSLHLNLLQEPVTYDPRKVADFTSTTISVLLFEGLIRRTPDSTTALGLAESVDISEDGKTYIFHLKDTKWSNGTPVTAYDIAQSWLDMLHPNFSTQNAHLLYPIENAKEAKCGKLPLKKVGINVINYNTLEVKLNTPTPFFDEIISYCMFSPVCQSYISENPNWLDVKDRSFVCNGPYRVAKRRIGRVLILEKNPYYWDADSVELEQISISIVDNETTALNMFLNNQIDMIGLPYSGIPTDSIPEFLNKGMIETTEKAASTICCFNLESFPFKNKNIRKAFAIALNRQEIVDNITQTGEAPGTQLLPDTLIPNQPTPSFKDGDIKTANDYLEKGLKELNISRKDFPSIKMLHLSTGIYPKVAQAIQEQWRKSLGVNIILEGFEYKVFLDKLGKKDFSITQCVWIAQYPDPMNILDRFCLKENIKNYPGYDNEEFRNLVNNSVYYFNKQDRFNELNKALDIINEDVPMTAVYHWKSPFMRKRYVKDLFIKPTGSFHLTSIKLDKDEVPSNRPIDVAVK